MTPVHIDNPMEVSIRPKEKVTTGKFSLEYRVSFTLFIQVLSATCMSDNRGNGLIIFVL